MTSNLKIACVGNMNNMMFPIARYLAKNGISVTLFLLDEYEHFLPIADTDSVDIEVVELGWGEESFEKVAKRKIQETFVEYNFFIGTDYSAGFLAKGHIKLDIYLPAGTDVLVYPFKRFNKLWIPETWEINKYKCARSQFWGIKQANHISCDKGIDWLEDSIQRIRGNILRIKPLPFLFINIETGQLEYDNIKLPIELVEPYNIIKESKFVVLQHSRQAWVYDIESPYNKGNDKLIRGFAAFSKEQDSALIVLLEYGENITETKQLIASLGIEEKVMWLPKMQRKYLMKFLALADVGVGELGHSWFSYGSVYETLASKVAFMGYRKDELYLDQYPELYPMINVNTSKQVAEQLEYYNNHRVELQDIGRKGNDWLMNQAIIPSVQKVLEIVNNHQGRKKFPIDWKLVFMEPYFWWIRFYNFFRIRFGKWAKT